MSFILEGTALNSEKNCQIPISQPASLLTENALNTFPNTTEGIFTLGLSYAQREIREAEDFASNARIRSLIKLEHPDEKAKKRLQCLVAGIALITFGAIATAVHHMTYGNS